MLGLVCAAAYAGKGIYGMKKAKSETHSYLAENINKTEGEATEDGEGVEMGTPVESTFSKVVTWTLYVLYILLLVGIVGFTAFRIFNIS
jgi:hypothetical protein